MLVVFVIFYVKYTHFLPDYLSSLGLSDILNIFQGKSFESLVCVMLDLLHYNVISSTVCRALNFSWR